MSGELRLIEITQELEGTPRVLAMLSKDSAAMRDEAGKIRHASTVALHSKAASQELSSAGTATLRRTHPEIFETEDVGTPLGDR